MNSKKKEVLFLLALAGLTFIVYLTSIKAPFVLDDNHMITKNVLIKDSQYFIHFLKGYVTNYPIPKGMCRPLLMLTFSFNYFNSGLNPLGYHIINIIIHFLNSTLLFCLLKLLKHNTPQKLLFSVTLLFAVHPLNTEAVTYISSRSDLMVTGFILFGFILYLKKKFLPVLLMYVLALLTKETALCLPLLILGYNFINKKSSLRGFNPRLNKNLYFIVSFVVITSLYIFYKTTLFSSANTRVLRSFPENILIQSNMTFQYLKLFIFPFNLNLIRHFPEPISLVNPILLISGLGVLILIGLVFKFKKTHPIISLGISWYLICLLPKFYARLHYVACEHHFYLPGIGIYIILTIILLDFCENRQKTFISISICLILIFSCLTSLRNYEYNDPLKFWKISEHRNPHSLAIKIFIASEYLNQKKFLEAENALPPQIKLKGKIENILKARIVLANIYIGRKEYKKALIQLKEAEKVKEVTPNHLYRTFGVLYMKLKDNKKAIEYFKKELNQNFSSLESYYSLGLINFNAGNLVTAKKYFNKTIKIDPDNFLGYFGTAKVYEKKNQLKTAISFYQKAISLKPNYAYSHYLLGSIYAIIGDGNAIAELNKAVRLQPDLSEAHNDLSIAYASSVPPKWDLSRKHAKIAISLGYKVNENFLQLLEDK